MKTDETFTENASGNHDYNNEQHLQQKNYVVLPDFVTAVINIFPFSCLLYTSDAADE